jgi:phosphonate transport system substrate-binding protein
MRNDSTRMTRRQALRTGAGLLGLGLLAVCAAPATAALASAETLATPELRGPALQDDLNEKGWPKAYDPLPMGSIPIEDAIAQKNKYKPLTDFITNGIGVPIDLAVTTSYSALVEAQRSKNIWVGSYGPLSFLLAEQQFGAVPFLVDAPDGVNPGFYNSLLMAGKDSPVKTVQDIKGQDFTFVDPASTSGNLFPRLMLVEEGIDPQKDVKGRFAGNHQNSILAVAKGQVPCGASNTNDLASAIRNGVIAEDEIVILKKSDPIPNGPWAAHPEMDPRAISKLQSVMGAFDDKAALTAIGAQGPYVPVDTAFYDVVRRAAKVLNLEFDEKGNVKPLGE